MNKSIKDIPLLADYDRYEGEKRHLIKSYDRCIDYRGYEILRNSYVPNGGYGKWEVPELNHLDIGGIKKGFLTVSITQAKEAIDKWFVMNEKLK